MNYWLLLHKRTGLDIKLMCKEQHLLKVIADLLNPYHWITQVRNKAFDSGMIRSRSFDVPIICIGNITVGGTGKTPHTEYLIKLLKTDENVAVLSRGYGRGTKGYIKSDRNSSMQTIGDEPFQIKKKNPDIIVAVCEKRVTGVTKLLAEKEPPSVILLDDAFQHRHIKAGLDILLVDSNRPIWEDCTLPFGRLRESANGRERADVIIVTKCDSRISKQQMEHYEKMLKTNRNVPVFFSSMEYGTPYPLFPDKASDKLKITETTEILLLTGIAKPEPLKKEIERRGATVTLMQYADHHKFVPKDIEDIEKKFSRIKGEKIIITTEKDATRLSDASVSLPQSIKENIYALPIEVKIIDGKENMFNQIIFDYVRKNSRNR